MIVLSSLNGYLFRSLNRSPQEGLVSSYIPYMLLFSGCGSALERVEPSLFHYSHGDRQMFLVSNSRCGEWSTAWFPIHRVVRGIANSHH